MDRHEFWMMMRQALLMALDAMEKLLEIKPTTADIRKAFKNQS